MDIDLIIRTSHVNRWQIVRTARQQTLAEHSYLVTMIAMKIAQEIGLGHETANEVTKYAMFHDAPEVITGDLASPVKAKITYDDSGYIGEYDEIRSKAQPIVPHIVKLADLMEAIIFLKVEGLTSHAEEVMTNLENEFLNRLETCKEEFPNPRLQLETCKEEFPNPRLQWDRVYEIYRGGKLV